MLLSLVCILCIYVPIMLILEWTLLSHQKMAQIGEPYSYGYLEKSLTSLTILYVISL